MTDRAQEPSFNQPAVIARTAVVRCNHCKGESFRVILDVRHRLMMSGEVINADARDVVSGIECTACGEHFVACQLGGRPVAFTDMMAR